MASAASRRALVRRSRRHTHRLGLHPGSRAARHPGRRRRHRRRVRGLPVSEHLRPGGRRRRGPAGHGLSARRRLHDRSRGQLRPVSAGARSGPGGRDAQLPPRRPGLAGPSGLCRSGRGRRRQLWSDGPAGGAALGAGQCRGLRGRPQGRHPVFGKLRGLERLSPDGGALVGGALQPGHFAERPLPGALVAERPGRSARAGPAVRRTPGLHRG